MGGRCPSAHTGADEGFHVLAPGCPRGRACAAGAPISSQRNGGKEGAGGSFLRWLRVDFHRRCPRHLRPPAPPSTGVHGGGGLYGQGKDRACIHARFLFSVRFRRCRAPGCTHRGCPASPGNSCAVPAWPAGPPSVPCLRNTGAITVAIRRGALCVRPPRAEGALQRKPPRPESCL